MTPEGPDAVEAPRRALLVYYAAHARALPWRSTRDPYAVWVSEVMLQQTRVETVIPYYQRFLERFPTVAVLAEAPESEVLARWSGLGYYRRARFLHAGARAVAERHGGVVPGDLTALRGLPGVGDYTAGAIGSIAFGLRAPLVDGNVERVLTRLYALGGDPRRAETKRWVWSLAERWADHDHPGEVNQALMELGATVCLPVSPRCERCPVSGWCTAYEQGEPERYPEKASKAEPRTERWVALIATRGDSVWLTPSTLGRWTGMLVPPMAQLARAKPSREAKLEALGAKGLLRGPRAAGSVTHVLTHARMEIEVLTGELVGDPPVGSLVPRAELPTLAVPTMTRRVLGRADEG